MKRTTEAGETMGETIRRATERMTDAFGDFFYDMLSGGSKAFKDFGETVKNLFYRLLADMAAAAMRNPIQILLGLTGVGASGAAQASGGGIFSSLFGGGSSGGGLLSGAGSILNLGSSLIGGLSGGSSALISGFMGGGFGGLASTAGELLSMGAAGIGSAFGAGGSMAGLATGLGAIGSVALPIIGIALLASSLLGGKKKPKMTFANMSNDSWAGFSGWEKGVSASSPFGIMGLTNQGTKNVKVDAAELQQTLDSMAQLDQAFAASMGTEEIERIKRALNNFVVRGKSVNFESILQRRLSIIISTSDLLWKNLLSGGDPSQQATSFGALRSIQKWTQTPAAFDTSAARTQRELFDESTRQLREFAKTVGSNVEAQVQLAQVLEQRAAAEQQYLSQFAQLRTTLNQQLNATRESIQLTGLSGQETYDYYKRQVNEWYTPQLDAMTDPEKILELVGKINAATGAAWSALGSDPAAQLAKKAEFLGYLQELEVRASRKIDMVEEQARSEAAELRAVVADTMNNLNGAANNLSVAAANIAASSVSLTQASGMVSSSIYNAETNLPFYG
jgi:hypothetical protein